MLPQGPILVQASGADSDEPRLDGVAGNVKIGISKGSGQEESGEWWQLGKGLSINALKSLSIMR